MNNRNEESENDTQSQSDKTDLVQTLLEAGADPNAIDNDGWSILLHAASSNQVEKAKLLLEHGANPNAQTKEGFASLHFAAYQGNADMANLLIEHHADIDIRAQNGFTPLHVCAKEDKVNVATILMRNGAKWLTEEDGKSPLGIAIKFRSLNMIKFLSEYAENADNPSSSNSLENVQYDAKESIERELIDDYTPLHKAAFFNNLDAAKVLLDHGANPDARTEVGVTPLICATDAGNFEMVKLLLDHGADINLGCKCDEVYQASKKVLLRKTS